MFRIQPDAFKQQLYSPFDFDRSSPIEYFQRISDDVADSFTWIE